MNPTLPSFKTSKFPAWTSAWKVSQAKRLPNLWDFYKWRNEKFTGQNQELKSQEKMKFSVYQTFNAEIKVASGLSTLPFKDSRSVSGTPKNLSIVKILFLLQWRYTSGAVAWLSSPISSKYERKLSIWVASFWKSVSSNILLRMSPTIPTWGKF